MTRLLWTLCLSAVLMPFPASSQTANPFAPPIVPALAPAAMAPTLETQIIRELPPLSFFAVIGDVALLSDGARVIRVPHGRRVTINSVTYRAKVTEDTLTLDRNGTTAFYATVGYGVAMNQDTPEATK